MHRLLHPFLAALLFVACASPQPLQWNLDAAHPASPSGQEAAYEMPPNVLARDSRQLPVEAPPPMLGPDGLPADVCLVSGAKLGSMGEPVVLNHNGHQVKFCCPACIEEFEEDPAAYLDKFKALVQDSPY